MNDGIPVVADERKCHAASSGSSVDRTEHKNRSKQAKRRTCQAFSPFCSVEDELYNGAKRMTRQAEWAAKKRSNISACKCNQNGTDDAGNLVESRGPRHKENRISSRCAVG